MQVLFRGDLKKQSLNLIEAFWEKFVKFVVFKILTDELITFSAQRDSGQERIT